MSDESSVGICKISECTGPKGRNKRFCAGHVLTLFMESVAAYRGFLALLRPIRPVRETSDYLEDIEGDPERLPELGHEHYMLVENSLHATILRKYLTSDDVSLENTLLALEEKLGKTLPENLRAPFLERMSRSGPTSVSHERAEFVESYLYSEVIHDVPNEVGRFSGYPANERQKLPAALVGWIDVVSNRVLELEGLIDKVAKSRREHENEDWGKEYQAQTPSDPTFTGAVIFSAAHDPGSADYRYAQEYIRERDERYFRALDNVKTVQPEPPVKPRPKVNKKNVKRLFHSFE